MGKDIVWERTSYKKLPKKKQEALLKKGHNPKHWRDGIPNPYTFARKKSRESENWYGKYMTPAFLRSEIAEFTEQPLSLADAKAIMRKAGITIHG